jgi:hypothetical protein
MDIVGRIRLRLVAGCEWLASHRDGQEASEKTIVRSASSKHLNDAKAVKVKYNVNGWPLNFRPAGSPAGVWPHTSWWHCAQTPEYASGSAVCQT